MVTYSGSVAISVDQWLTQRLLEVGDQVAGVLDADGEAQQIVGRPAAGRLHAGAVLDQAFDSAERRGAFPELELRAELQRGRRAAMHAQREHAAEAAAHLTR